MFMVFGVLFVGFSQPIMMVLGLGVFSIVYSVYMYMIMGDFWYSYMLLLIVLSGIVVVFMYMSSLIPNERFEYMGVIFMFLLLIMLYSFGNIDCSVDVSFMALGLWIFIVSEFNIFIVSFLLFIMVMVVWLTSFYKMPVRV